MKRKTMLQLSAVVFAVFAAVMLVACGAASSGFANQEALAKAHFDTFRVPTNYVGANGPSIEDTLRFYHGAADMANAPIMQTLREIQKAGERQARAEHDAKMKGNWVLDYNADGTAKTRFTGENKLGGITQAEYRTAHEDARKTAQSYKYVSSRKLDAETTALAAGSSGLATHVEVREITFEYTPWVNGAAGTKVTDQKYTIEMQRIGSKWYLVGEADIGSIIGGLLPSNG